MSNKPALRFPVHLDGNRVGNACTWLGAERIANMVLDKLDTERIEWGPFNTREISTPFERRFEFWTEGIPR